MRFRSPGVPWDLAFGLPSPRRQACFGWHAWVVLPLVVRGEVPRAARFPIPLSIRTCGFPAYGLPMIFCAWLRCLRIADGTAEPVQALSLEPLACPPPCLPGA